MKKFITKGLAVLLALSLLMSFAACGKDKQEATTGIPTTAEPGTTTPVTEPAATPISVEMIKLALNSSGSPEWDGDYASLTDEQKLAVTEYFNAAGKKVEFRDDNVYFVEGSVETTLLPNETTAPQVSTTKTIAGNIAVRSIALNVSTATLNVGGTKALTATLSPGNAGNKSVNWKSDNDKVASVNAGGMVYAKSEGTANIICTANSDSNVRAVCTITVTSTPSGALLSYKYNEDEGFFYIEDDPWQRNFGFNRLYDKAAPITQMFYGTVRVQFKYRNLDWMIQMWKGQYGYAFIGGEIGVYTRTAGLYPNTNLDHYDCASDENSLKMQMTLYQGSKWLFDRNYKTYWWITGFVPGSLSRFKDPSELTMLAMITLKDSNMKNAFVTALEGCGFKKGAYKGFSTPDIYKVEGNTVYFNWKNTNIENRVKITFDANGGTGGWGPTLMNYGAPLTAPAVTRDGYTFLGWSSGLLSGIVSIPSKVPSADKTYKAQWTINSYPITFDANGGEGGTGPTMMDYGAPLTAPEVSREGYTFLGWSTGLFSSIVTIPATVPAQSTGAVRVYKAQWE